MELTINNTVYQFKAGFGFLREVNKRDQVEIKGTAKKKDIGLQYLVAELIDGDAEALVDALDLLNSGMEPRVTKADLESHIENEDTDIDTLFESVLDFLSKSNTTKQEVTNFRAEVKKKMAETKQNPST